MHPEASLPVSAQFEAYCASLRTRRTQYHAQDGLGRYRYSFRQPGSAREEYVDENGRVQGSYSYDMPNGERWSSDKYRMSKEESKALCSPFMVEMERRNEYGFTFLSPAISVSEMETKIRMPPRLPFGMCV